MEGVIQFLETHFPILLTHRYLFVLLGATLEGINTPIISGFLASIGQLNFWGTYALLVLGHTLSGYMWYSVGYFAGGKSIDKWLRRNHNGKKVIEKVEQYFHRYSGRAIVLTKLTFSLTIATLITAGSLKYNLKRFSLYSFIGSALWISFTYFVGYFFGQSYQLFIGYIKNFVFFVLFLAIAIIVVYVLKSAFSTAFIKALFLNEMVQDFSGRLKKAASAILMNGVVQPEEKSGDWVVEEGEISEKK